MKVISYISRGNSCPIILEDKGQQYFVKLRAGMSGKHALISEWIGNKLDSQLAIKAQIPTWIELENKIEFDDINIEVRELVLKSIGINIGFEYQKDAKEVNKRDLLNDKEAKEIFLFDLMMINIDRTPSNMNLMKLGSEIISVDYESSQLLQELLSNKNLLNDNRILQCLRNNPLYQEISEEEINEFIAKTEKLSIIEIIREIPLGLLSEKERNSLIKGFYEKEENKWFLKETMNKLRDIKIETKEEQKRRRTKNQEDFKRKFKENAAAN